MLAGAVSLEAVLVSIIAGLGPTTVIMGKHMDKGADDRARGIRSLPVVLGDEKSRLLTRLLVVMHFVLIAVAAWWISLWLLLPVAALMSALPFLRVLEQPLPASCPDTYPVSVWPLWFVAHGFRFNRDFGLLLLAGSLLA